MKSPHYLYLAALLLLTGCASQPQLFADRESRSERDLLVDSLRQENEQLRAQYAVLQDTFQFYDEIDSGRFYRQVRSLNDRINRLEYDLSVSRDGGLTVATLQTDELFEPASATLTAKGAERLTSLAEQLNAKHQDKKVRIEGHSDSVPVGPGLQEKYPSNWELSAARAATVARYLIGERKMEESRFEVTSFGSAQPVASNGTADGRRQNRRIRIAVLPAPAEEVAAKK